MLTVKMSNGTQCEHAGMAALTSVPRCFCFMYAGTQMTFVLFPQNGTLVLRTVTSTRTPLFQSLDYDRCINDPYLEVLETVDNKVGLLSISWD